MNPTSDQAKLVRGRRPGDNWVVMERKLIRVFSPKCGVKIDHLYRITLLRTPFFSVKLHKILGSDEDRYLHDHPWHYVSLILRGSYHEERDKGSGVRRPGHLLLRKATRPHRLTLLTPYVWTLFLTSGRGRIWGFHTENGWIPHYELDNGDVIQLP